MSKTSSNQSIEEWGNNSNVSKTIAKQIIEGSLVYCANGPMGVSSHMFKTRLKQGSEEICRDCPNEPKKIDKQGIEVRLGYCTKGPMGVRSPMSKTRSKLVSEGKWRDCSNVSKTI